MVNLNKSGKCSTWTYDIHRHEILNRYALLCVGSQSVISYNQPCLELSVNGRRPWTVILLPSPPIIRIVGVFHHTLLFQKALQYIFWHTTWYILFRIKLCNFHEIFTALKAFLLVDFQFYCILVRNSILKKLFEPCFMSYRTVTWWSLENVLHVYDENVCLGAVEWDAL